MDDLDDSKVGGGKGITGTPAMRSLATKLRNNQMNLMLYFAIFVLVLIVYHLLSDGDFSFLMTLGGMFRLFAFLLLIWKVHSQQNAAGVSFKTLQCYVMSFVFRLSSILFFDGYLPYDRSGDWFYQFVEVVALAMVCIAVYLVAFKHSITYERSQDGFGVPILPSDFGVVFLAGPALIVAILMHPSLNNFWPTDVAWTFAMYLEAVAILPQLYMFHKKGGEVEAFTSHFVFCLGVARLLHLVFWLSTHAELANHYSALPGGSLVGYVVVASQIVHLVLMVDFFYYYLMSVRKGGPIILPTTTHV